MSELYGRKRKNPNTLWRVDRDIKVANEALRRTIRYEAKGGKKSNHTPDVPGPLTVGKSTEWDLRAAPSEDLVEAVVRHYKAHEAEYHDLAVMQAYMEGVDLNLEQPLVIGAKNDKDTSESESHPITHGYL